MRFSTWHKVNVPWLERAWLPCGVHINDPQPYYRNIERLFRGRSIEDVVRDHRRILGRDRATELEVGIYDHISTNILQDAPSERLNRDARAILTVAGLRLVPTCINQRI